MEGETAYRRYRENVEGETGHIGVNGERRTAIAAGGLSPAAVNRVRMQNSGVRIQNSGFGIQNSEYPSQTPNSEPRTRNPELQSSTLSETQLAGEARPTEPVKSERRTVNRERRTADH